jgi:plasmid maintenance system killer protein
MKIHETAQYLRTQKRVIKKHALTQSDIDRTLTLFKKDPKNSTLHFKKMTCKKDKDRYSIRVVNTQYRILMNIMESEIYLVCICDHDEYDRRNRGC